ncbi:MAG: citramalate synthase [Ruminococcaceae bacterium]|nr:citramalate synthase [Oscillospiraceae bacterium]
MNIQIFDTTLRDGIQGANVSYSVEDKLNILRSLDKFGIGYIEAGTPFSNPKEQRFFELAVQRRMRHARLVAFGSTHRRGMTAENDEACLALLSAETPAVTIFGKSWDFHAQEVLGVSNAENLEMIENTVSFFKSRGREVFFDAEHFFDGYKNNPGYAVDTLIAAQRAGADKIILCDTCGGCFPDEIHTILSAVAKKLNRPVGVHFHNDVGCADANALMAVKAGADLIQGTFIGIGERCGNTNLSSVIPSLQLKLGHHCIPEENLPNLTRTANRIAEITNIIPDSSLPYIGRNAFAHKGGMHVDGVLKNPTTFEHISPDTVGNSRHFLVSEVSGRSAAVNILHKLGSNVSRTSEETSLLINALKQKENNGYQFESAAASVELLALKALGEYKPTFSLIHYNTSGRMPVTDGENSATALLKIRVGDSVEVTGAEGDGPVNALDMALRRALEVFYPRLKNVRLSDYKVRVMNPGAATAANVRVLIDSTDGITSWTTVGVSTDIIEASWLALVDSMEYYLLINTQTEDSAAEEMFFENDHSHS